MFDIRPARTEDAAALTEIAARGEAHWGYDASFMTAFRDIYKITEEFIRTTSTFVLEEDGCPIGFYSLVADGEETELEYMYLDAGHLGRGFGKRLWAHMTDQCRTMNIRGIGLVCGPQPKAFYSKMGAVLIGETDSLVLPNRRVARMSYSIPARQS